MPATPRPILYEIRWFMAKYPGACAECEIRFQQGDQIGFNSEGQIVGFDCCASVETESDFDSFNRGRPPTIRVMPTGKTKADKCPRCFMIHSIGQGDNCE